jgi:poly-gamma-glutamate capsule biosynthesis protein CapA/YwtB (metallophosphatase superfamily)
LIAYSLGNFVFDSPKWVTRHVAESLILRIRLNKNGLVDAGIVPIQITDSRPDVASKRQRKLILDRLNVLSQRYGTVLADDGKLQFSPGTVLIDQ